MMITCALLILEYVIQTGFGFAGTAIVTPFLLRIIGRAETVALSGVLGLIACIAMVVKERKHICYLELIKMLAAMSAGILISFVLQTRVDFSMLKIAYSVAVMIISVVLFLTNGKIQLSAVAEYVVLVLAGVMHGTLVCGGPLLVAVAIRRIPEKHYFRGTINAIWVGTNTLLVIQHIRQGFYTPEFLSNLPLRLGMLAIGIFLGNLLHDHIRQDRFTRAGSVLLFFSGVSMVV